MRCDYCLNPYEPEAQGPTLLLQGLSAKWFAQERREAVAEHRAKQAEHLSVNAEPHDLGPASREVWRYIKAERAGLMIIIASIAL